MSNFFPSPYEEFIYKSRYARWLEDEGRREDWPETVSRYINFMEGAVNRAELAELFDEVENSILTLEVVPSMRALMTAGSALARDNTCGYNCSYLPIDSVESFDEAMFILLCGTGVGYSVETKYTSQLPRIPDGDLEESEDSDTVVVEDSKEGWARALRQILSLLYRGKRPRWSMVRVRPAGARLKTFGGRASGPGPLVQLFDFVVRCFENARGRQLYPIECHDILCKIGEIVVVGGVRRSALISLTDLNDDDLRVAKSGEWWVNNAQRALANNSVAYDHKPSTSSFFKEWVSLYDSKSGERGIFSRPASVRKASENGRRDTNYEFGTNPCSEIILRPYQFCNLTEVVVRSTDTIKDLERKVRVATILGTFQSTLTNFPYLRDVWRKNTEDERLLGVSLTGIMDNDLLNGRSPDLAGRLERLKGVAVETNAWLAGVLGIPQSTAITCVKPSGTVSQLVDSASGIHPRHSEYYERAVRIDNKDPIRDFLIMEGVRHEADVMKPENTTVFFFPIHAPSNSVMRNDRTAIQQLETWLTYQRHWCEHKPSITVYVKEDEWPGVGAWVWEHFDELSGVSFLPFSDHTYQQAPYTVLTKDEYDVLKEASPRTIDWTKLMAYEKEDRTIGSQQYACSGDSCEVVDLA